MKIVIVGAGISGLACAWYLKKRFKEAVDITILEQANRVGGSIQTLHAAGSLWELGPRGLRGQGSSLTTSLIQELGLENHRILANKQASIRYVLHQGKLARFGLPFLLRQGIPLRDLFVSPSSASDETIASFCTRRLGKKITQLLIDPLTKGIYGGSIETLSIRSCFPTLWRYEQERGSLIRGFLSNRTKRESVPPLYSFSEGMQMLPDRLAQHVGAQILLSHPVTDLRKENGVWIINKTLQAECLIATTPSLLPLLKLPSICPYQTLSITHLGWKAPLLQKKGFGFLVPSEERLPFLGMTWDSSIFPEHNGAMQARICIMGNEDLSAQAPRLAHTYLQITPPPDFTYSYQAHRAIPQYTLGYEERRAQLFATLPPNFHLIGTWEGVSVHASIQSAHCLAHTLKY